MLRETSWKTRELDFVATYLSDWQDALERLRSEQGFLLSLHGTQVFLGDVVAADRYVTAIGEAPETNRVEFMSRIQEQEPELEDFLAELALYPRATYQTAEALAVECSVAPRFREHILHANPDGSRVLLERSVVALGRGSPLCVINADSGTVVNRNPKALRTCSLPNELVLLTPQYKVEYRRYETGRAQRARTKSLPIGPDELCVRFEQKGPYFLVVSRSADELGPYSIKVFEPSSFSEIYSATSVAPLGGDIDISSDGTLLAFTPEFGKIEIIRIKEKQKVCEVPLGLHENNYIYGIIISRDNTKLLVNYHQDNIGCFKMFDTSTGKRCGPSPAYPNYTLTRFLLDGKFFIYVTHEKQLHLTETESGRGKTLPVRVNTFRGILISSDEKRLIVPNGDREISLMDPTHPKALRTMEADLFAFSPDGSRLAVKNGDTLTLVNAASGAIEVSYNLPKMDLPDAPYDTIFFSPDGSKLCLVKGILDKSEVVVLELSSGRILVNKELTGYPPRNWQFTRNGIANKSYPMSKEDRDHVLFINFQ